MSLCQHFSSCIDGCNFMLNVSEINADGKRPSTITDQYYEI